MLRGLPRLPLLAPQRRAAVVLRVGDVVAVAVVGEEHLELLADQHHLVQGSVDGKIVMVKMLVVNGYSWILIGNDGHVIVVIYPTIVEISYGLVL